MLLRISKLLCLVSAVALVFASDILIWHVLPVGFEGTVYGAFAFWSGSAISLLALVLAIFSLQRSGRTGSGVRVCVLSTGLLGAFGITYVYGLFST